MDYMTHQLVMKCAVRAARSLADAMPEEMQNTLARQEHDAEVLIGQANALKRQNNEIIRAFIGSKCESENIRAAIGIQ